jgi:hypothetical protein
LYNAHIPQPDASFRRLTFHLPDSVTGDVGQRREMMPLGDVLRRALDRDERLDGFDFGKRIEAIEALPEGSQTRVTNAGRCAAEGLLCGLPPSASEDEIIEAVVRLTQGDPLMAASAITFLIALHGGWSNAPPLLAARFHAY